MIPLGVIPIKLSKREIVLIDYLVKTGRFKSRNEAIRHMIRKGLQELLDDFSIPDESDKMIDELLKVREDILIIKTDKTAEELVREERERV